MMMSGREVRWIVLFSPWLGVNILAKVSGMKKGGKGGGDWAVALFVVYLYNFV